MTVSRVTEFNVRMSGVHPNWYEHVDKVDAAIAECDRESKCFIDAGWDCDEGGCYFYDQLSGSSIHENDWSDEMGRPLPSEVREYTKWMADNCPGSDPYPKAPEDRRLSYQKQAK